MDDRKRARAKTTVYLDADLLRAVKVRAAEEGRHDYEIYEALREYLAAGQRAREQERVVNEAIRRVMMESLASQSEPIDDDEATELAKHREHNEA